MPPVIGLVNEVGLGVFALACFTLWIYGFRVQRETWRFELFAIDFAFGAFLLASVAAIALGDLTTDLPFGDRLLVSSRTAQALMFGAGLMYGVGNTLLLAATSLLGTAGAFAISGGLAVAIGTMVATNPMGQVRDKYAITLLAFAGAVLAIWACRLTSPRVTPVKGQPLGPIRLSRSTKGSLVAVLGGIGMGMSYPLAVRGAFDDFGLGPYAGVFMLCAGVLAANLVFSLYFFNIALEGGALPLHSYWKNSAKRHVPGIVSGAFWASGALAVLLAHSGTDQSFTAGAVPLLSIPLVMLIGIYLLREFTQAAAMARVVLLAGLAALLASLGLLLTAHSSTSPVL